MEEQISEPLNPRQEAIEKYSRDQYGLLKSVNYAFNEDGSINYRALVKPEFLYVNKGYFEKWNKETPNSIEGLGDRQLLILLGGIKDVAKIRGYSSVYFNISGERDHVVANCRINWIGNYETGGKEVAYEDFANASTNNTDEFCHKFLETIACNRAFVRCVRNFLNINIVGDDEIDKSNRSLSIDSSQNEEDHSFLSPHAILEKISLEKGISSYENFVIWLREQWKKGSYKNELAKDWKKYSDVPVKECRRIISLLEWV